MNFKNTEIVPTTVEEDENRGASHWHEGKYAWLDEGTHVTFYIGHQTENTEDGVVTRAYPIRVAKPVSRDMAINFAEMEVYGLRDAMAVASFNASLARKHRADGADPEVREHDEFIEWVRGELTKIGV